MKHPLAMLIVNDYILTTPFIGKQGELKASFSIVDKFE